MYEKYALDPLQAWFFIQQASTRLQARLIRQYNVPEYTDCETNHLSQEDRMQRLFWSIYKAEHELLVELPFRSSGIEKFSRADSMFPSPPMFEQNNNQASLVPETQTQSHERSWAFYLAEISIRRTLSDTICTLYRKGERYWLTHVSSLIRQCEECKDQIQLWYSYLPDTLRFDHDMLPDNELAFFMQGRFQSWQCYIYQPLLYYVLHRPDAQDLTQQIIACTDELMSVCADGIVHYSRHHRHGGTWFTCRGSFSYALLMLGVVLKADANVPPHSDWRQLVLIALSILRKWEEESSDIQRLRTTLERLYSEVCRIADNNDC